MYYPTLSPQFVNWSTNKEIADLLNAVLCLVDDVVDALTDYLKYLLQCTDSLLARIISALLAIAVKLVISLVQALICLLTTLSSAVAKISQCPCGILMDLLCVIVKFSANTLNDLKVLLGSISYIVKLTVSFIILSLQFIFKAIKLRIFSFFVFFSADGFVVQIIWNFRWPY